MIESSGACRSCSARGTELILDLGPQPDPDRLIDPADPASAPEAPVELVLCPACGLVQLLGPRPEGPVPAHGHAMSAQAGDPWIAFIERKLKASAPVVCDVDGSSGLSAGPFASARHVMSGLPTDPADAVDLILVGHALAHVDDLDALVGRIASALGPGGLITVDFHHVLGLAQGQFDVISHAHRSYLSLHSIEGAFERHALQIVAAEHIPDFGGTVRVLATHRSDGVPPSDNSGAARIREAERTARIAEAAGYEGLAAHVRVTCAAFVAFLDEAGRAGRTVAGYGAASRGTTLINIAGVGVDLLPFVVDRSASKQGRLLPRARIPILAPSELDRAAPDDVVILPWPLAKEIAGQLSGSRLGEARLVVAIPRLKLIG